jgi:predicted phage-related endonuclease
LIPACHNIGAGVAVEIREITDRETWLAWRRTCVTASRVGGLPAFNCHPFYTPLRIYAELRGVEFPDDNEDPVLRRGRWLEPAVAKAVSEQRPDWALTLPGVFLIDPAIGLGATPDYYISGDPRGRGILQIKTVAPSVYVREWDSGADIPLWVVLQTLSEMMLHDADFGAVAVMLVDAFRMDVKILDVPRHAQAEAKLIAETKRFMLDVAEMREPDVNFARDGSVLKLLLPKERPGTEIDLSGDNELPVMLAQRARLRYQIRRAEVACEAIENRIRYEMGEAASVIGIPGFGITYKTSDYEEYTVEAHSRRVLRIRDKRPKEERPGFEEDTDDD